MRDVTPVLYNCDTIAKFDGLETQIKIKRRGDDFNPWSQAEPHDQLVVPEKHSQALITVP